MKGVFLKKVLTLLKGTFWGQIIIVITSPILTRLYSVEEFGALAIYISILSIIVVNGSFRFEITILHPDSDNKAMRIAFFCIGLLILNSLILITLTSLLGESIINYFELNLSPLYFYLLPISFFGLGINQILTFWALRLEEYKLISKTKINQNFSMVFTQVALGLLGFNKIGILIGDVVGRISGNFDLIRLFWRDYREFRSTNRIGNIKSFIKEYYKYPVFSSVSNLLNNIAMQSPTLLLAIHFNPSIVGFFSLCMRVGEAPISMLGKSIGQVFLKEVSTNVNSSRDNANLKLFKMLLTRLVIIGVPIFITLYIGGPYIFEFVFGEKWFIAGLYIKYLSFMLVAELLASPLNQILDLLQRQKLFLLWQTVRIFLVLVILLIVPFYTSNDLTIIKLYSGVMCATYLILIYIVYKTLTNKNTKVRGYV
jgi:O-antigen/teichoic acid export membrane protein